MLACAPQGRTRPTVTACASAEEDATCTCLYLGAEGRDSKASAEAHVRLVPTHSFVPGAQLPHATRFVHYGMNSKPRPRKRASRSPVRVAITPEETPPRPWQGKNRHAAVPNLEPNCTCHVKALTATIWCWYDGSFRKSRFSGSRMNFLPCVGTMNHFARLAGASRG